MSYTLSEKKVLVRDFEAKSVSLASWCRLHGLAKSTFSDWLEKYGSGSRVKDEGKFYSLGKEDLVIEVDAFRIHVSPGVDKSLLATVLEVLHARD